MQDSRMLQAVMLLDELFEPFRHGRTFLTDILELWAVQAQGNATSLIIPSKLQLQVPTIGFAHKVGLLSALEAFLRVLRADSLT